MPALSIEDRKRLSDAVVLARGVGEGACGAVLGGLGVFASRRPEHLGEVQAGLRVGLRARARQLGDGDGLGGLLVAECAYEQFHRLLFARFLAENNLLLHPQFRAPVSLAECEELAPELGEPDGWSVAARFAAEILPGIFRVDDPCVRLRLAPEGREALEEIVEGLPPEVFISDDGLGWVYQFWQKDKKDEVNRSERKIGGADVGPVTQLFTENYMVRFLLENSLGAWWAARHPDSPLLKDWEFLRFDDDGSPAAGAFDGWPDTVAEVTVMDPCCGSGHFLVEAFGMLWRMRAEEEGLDPVAAQDAVLRDNLFGLELDPRCVQIAMFAVALAAWKAGGGWRELPVPHIACSGIPAKAPVEEWTALAAGDERLEAALVRLHILFRDADTIGSLIDPKRAVEITDPTGLQSSFEDVEWDDIAPLLEQAVANETADPATAVLGTDAAGIARAADYLSRTYTLITTNVPYLHKSRQSEKLRGVAEVFHSSASEDLATIFLHRLSRLPASSGLVAAVTPRTWLLLGRYSRFRKELLSQDLLSGVSPLGPSAFSGIGGEVVDVGLVTLRRAVIPGRPNSLWGVDAIAGEGPAEKASMLVAGDVERTSCAVLLAGPDGRIVLGAGPTGPLLDEYASSLGGITTGDSPRYRAAFWEVAAADPQWTRQVGPPSSTQTHAGREYLIRWEGGKGDLVDAADDGATIAGRKAWGRLGVAVRITGKLPVTLYHGELYENVVSVVVPNQVGDLGALWAFCSSDEYHGHVRSIDHKIGVTSHTLAKVPFDVEYWRRVAAERWPDGLPEPWSDDPTQWLFEGRPEVATEPLQVAVGRLLGFRWPEQPESDDLDGFADVDGIVCVPSVSGEAPAAERLEAVLAAAFGDEWSPAKRKELLEGAGSKKSDLDGWLRDEFFKAHCKVFANRPFVWHIWDGRKDGFSALVNYHRLDRKNLEKLTYAYLGGDWVERQRAGVRDEVAGAEARLGAALELKAKLEAILEGEPPFDIYVRWKSLAEQPVGWDPDLNDGVRLNVRPFVEAGVLRAKFNVHWRKDRGKNPDGTERHNDLHYTTTQKAEARAHP